MARIEQPHCNECWNGEREVLVAPPEPRLFRLITIESQQAYALPDDLTSIGELWVELGAYSGIHRMLAQQISAQDFPYRVQLGCPVAFCVDGRQLKLWPVPDAEYRIDFVERSALYDELVAATRRSFHSNDKSIELLKSWLSPEQLKQFETDGTFEVCGEYSRKTYKIDQKSAYNVVDSKGTELCFVPSGAAGIGDTMLAQKIALETDERHALKVANKKKPPGSLFNGWFGV